VRIWRRLIGRCSPRLAENRTSRVDFFVRRASEPRFSGCLIGRDSARLAENRAVVIRFCGWPSARASARCTSSTARTPPSVEVRERAPVEHGVIPKGHSCHDDVIDDRDSDRFCGAHNRRRCRDVLLARGRIAARMIVTLLLPNALCGSTRNRHGSFEIVGFGPVT
jgi:hypothetical protein